MPSRSIDEPSRAVISLGTSATPREPRAPRESGSRANRQTDDRWQTTILSVPFGKRGSRHGNHGLGRSTQRVGSRPSDDRDRRPAPLLRQSFQELIVAEGCHCSIACESPEPRERQTHVVLVVPLVLRKSRGCRPPDMGRRPSVQARPTHVVASAGGISGALALAPRPLPETVVAHQTAALAKDRILQQATISILAQANAAPELALPLLP